MPELLVICDDCGKPFGSGMRFENVRNVTFKNTASQCPYCPGMGRVPDGVYDFVDETIRLLSGSASSVEDIKRLAAVLELVRVEHLEPAQAVEDLRRQGGVLAKIAALLPENKNQWYAFLMVILALIAEFRRQDSATTQVNIENIQVDQIITQVINPNAPRKSDASAGVPKVGRNDPCPCGSGAKFKRCHGFSVGP